MHELGFIDETRINVYKRPDQESTEEGKEMETGYLIIILIGYDCRGQRQTVYG